jgi:hypothetical protein
MFATKKEPSRMKRVAVVLAALAAFAWLSPALAAEKDALGTWDVVATTADRPVPSVMTNAKVDGKLKAQAAVACSAATRTAAPRPG